MDNQQPHQISYPYSDEMMELFISQEKNVYTMSINGRTKALFHRVDPKSAEDQYWYTSSREGGGDHLLRLYGAYSWQNDVYFSSEVYDCTLETWINRSTSRVTVQKDVRLNDSFQRILRTG